MKATSSFFSTKTWIELSIIARANSNEVHTYVLALAATRQCAATKHWFWGFSSYQIVAELKHFYGSFR